MIEYVNQLIQMSDSIVQITSDKSVIWKLKTK